MRESTITSSSLEPAYELRLKVRNPTSWGLAIYQMPCPATPWLKKQKRIASLEGAALRLIDASVLKRVLKNKILLDALKPDRERSWQIDEGTALHLGLLFRAMTSMKNSNRIREVVAMIGQMGEEEANYWMSMVMYRKNPHRVLAALRMLLTSR